MDLIADFVLICGALGAAIYCFVLSQRLSRFTDLERGIGGAVAVLSAQVDDLSRTLQSASAAAEGSGADLAETTRRAEEAARRIEIYLAAMHDIPPKSPVAAPERPASGDMRGTEALHVLFADKVGGRA